MGLLWIVDHLPEVNIRDTQDSAERIGDFASMRKRRCVSAIKVRVSSVQAKQCVHAV